MMLLVFCSTQDSLGMHSMGTQAPKAQVLQACCLPLTGVVEFSTVVVKVHRLSRTIRHQLIPGLTRRTHFTHTPHIHHIPPTLFNISLSSTQLPTLSRLSTFALRVGVDVGR